VRRIGVVSVGRSDFGLYRPLLNRLKIEPSVDLRLFVSGSHLDRRHGHTIDEIQTAGFKDLIRVPVLEAKDSPEAIGQSMGRAVLGFSRALARWRPDILVVLGDRFEMHAAALAALPHTIPVAHIHGGEITEGAIDDALRHSLTKLSHLHFPSTSAYVQRIRQLGEEPWRIRLVGAIGLDNLSQVAIPGALELARRLGRTLPEGFILATYHPVTLEHADTARQIDALLGALDRFGRPVLFTAPNADTQRHIIDQRIKRYVSRHGSCVYISNLGTENYFGAMAAAVAMVGNSSSGIIEAASFKLPVVNIGARQAGRVRPASVIDCACETGSIERALRKAISAVYKRICTNIRNPYDQGGASERIAERLLDVDIDSGKLLRKRFCDLT